MTNFNAIRIVLVNTSHPGNIGAAARAMKVMGLSRLYLVSPVRFPAPEATAMAAGADDILENAIVTKTLEEALEGTSFVIGTSARLRQLSAPCFDPQDAAVKICEEAENREAAILFGEERIGLTNEHLSRCHAYVSIPCNPEFSSLNLAQAVQVIAYELRRAQGVNLSIYENTEKETLATAEELEGFYDHLYRLMVLTKFLDPEKPKRLMERLRRLFNRTRLESREVNILRGIFTAAEQLKKEREI